jgi:hypothetical protein
VVTVTGAARECVDTLVIPLQVFQPGEFPRRRTGLADSANIGAQALQWSREPRTSPGAGAC